MKSSVLRLLAWCCALAVLALVSLGALPSSAAAAPGAAKLGAKHAVAQATQGISVRSAAHSATPSDDWGNVGEDCDDDSDDDCDDDDGDADPDVLGPTSRLPLPGLALCTDTGFGDGSLGRAIPGARELPEDPP